MSRRPVEPIALALLVVGLGCASNSRPPAAPGAPGAASDVTRFRLLLSDNPVDPREAFRCHGRCQEQGTPEGYLQCLSECPGFEQTPGVACAPNEVPPLAACFTARPAPVGSEPRAGSVVVAVIADIPLMVGVAAVCASQTEPCGYGGGLVP
jgi:hypothetical protein